MYNKPHSEDVKKKIGFPNSIAKSGKPRLDKRRESKIENGEELFICGTCKEFFPKDGFYKNKRTILGLTSECRKCFSATSMRTRSTENSRRLNREHMVRYREKNIDKIREKDRERSKISNKTPKAIARYELNKAVKRGDVLKPKICSECFSSQKRIEGHHKDYNKHLEVEWLCTMCHAKRHHKQVLRTSVKSII